MPEKKSNKSYDSKKNLKIGLGLTLRTAAAELCFVEEKSQDFP